MSALAAKIEEILGLDRYVLEEMGEDARKFIFEEKNPKKQCEKIFNLIEHII